MRSHLKKQLVPIASLKPGPIRNNLTPDQERRIAAVRETFSEVLDQPLAQWIDDFRRDLIPEKEIVVWESMAAEYKKHVGLRTTPDARKRLYSSILMASLGAPDSSN
jgi:hypothetical protein